MESEHDDDSSVDHKDIEQKLEGKIKNNFRAVDYELKVLRIQIER